MVVAGPYRECSDGRWSRQSTAQHAARRFDSLGRTHAYANATIFCAASGLVAAPTIRDPADIAEAGGWNDNGVSVDDDGELVAEECEQWLAAALAAVLARHSAPRVNKPERIPKGCVRLHQTSRRVIVPDLSNSHTCRLLVDTQQLVGVASPATDFLATEAPMTNLRSFRWAFHRPTAFLGATLVAVTSAHAQLVNGSFEQPIVPPGGASNFAGGSNGIPGWAVVGVDVDVVDSLFTFGNITFQAQSGNQWLDLAGRTSNSQTSGVNQNVSTVAGQLYEVSFYVGSATNGNSIFPSTVDLSIDGGGRTSFTNPAAPTTRLDWKLFTKQFTATGNTTNIAFFNGSGPNNFLSGLDNVAVTAVPEPSGIGLISVITGIALARRRSRRRPANQR